MVMTEIKRHIIAGIILLSIMLVIWFLITHQIFLTLALILACFALLTRFIYFVIDDLTDGNWFSFPSPRELLSKRVKKDEDS